MSRSDPKILVRLPSDAKAFIAEQAARYGSSQNSEIVRCVRDRMEKIAATEAEIGVLSPAAAGHNNNRKDCCDAAER